MNFRELKNNFLEDENYEFPFDNGNETGFISMYEACSGDTCLEVFTYGKDADYYNFNHINNAIEFILDNFTEKIEVPQWDNNLSLEDMELLTQLINEQRRDAKRDGIELAVCGNTMLKSVPQWDKKIPHIKSAKFNRVAQCNNEVRLNEFLLDKFGLDIDGITYNVQHHKDYKDNPELFMWLLNQDIDSITRFLNAKTYAEEDGVIFLMELYAPQYGFISSIITDNDEEV